MEAFGYAGMRALHHACSNSHEGCIALLLDRGADANAVDEFGETFEDFFFFFLVHGCFTFRVGSGRAGSGRVAYSEPDPTPETLKTSRYNPTGLVPTDDILKTS